jgi:peptidoglycan/LPS O-acetylase OafA/YrhL
MLTVSLLLILYVALSLLVGFAMRKRRMGFVLAVVFSLLLTPVVMFFIMALTDFPGKGRQA